MPQYDYRCPSCGRVESAYRSVDNRNDGPECCGVKSEKVILSAPMGFVQDIYYTSPIDGRPITTKQARLDDMARNGCRPWEGMEQEKKEAQRRAAYADEKLDKTLDKAIGETLSALPSEKKAVLGIT
jgi:putative FmdB family regulatory protein